MLFGTTMHGSIVKSTLFSYRTNPNSPIEVGVKLDIPTGWHIYGQNPGDVGKPTAVSWRPANTMISLPWPKDQPFTLGPITSYGYSGSVTLPYRLRPNIATPLSVTASVSWIVCNTECIPESATLALTIDPHTVPIVAQSIIPPNTFQFPWAAMAGAFLGGLLLNLMPCVFPVLSLKILSLARLSGAHPTRLRKNGLLFSFGIISTIWGFAGILLAAKAGTEAIGWGFQLQSPLIISALILVFTALAANLFGAFEIGTSLTRLATKQSDTPLSTVLNGALLSTVATPCTAPFMGVALGAALTQPTIIAVLIFTALGIGLSLPYLILSFMPQWVSQLPKPGPWMETLKQALAFPLLATVAWLTWVLSNQAGSSAALISLLGTICVVAALWAYGKLAFNQSNWKYVAIGCAVVVSAITLHKIHQLNHTSDMIWEPYSNTAITEAQASNDTIFIDFTADWCLTCQFNEQTVLKSKGVEDAFSKYKVRKFKADWTDRNPEITQALRAIGRSGVPAYVVYRPGRQMVVLPELLTTQAVIEAVTAAP